jgi:uncharacterized repeat protein (TIGR01451 family)
MMLFLRSLLAQAAPRELLLSHAGKTPGRIFRAAYIAAFMLLTAPWAVAQAPFSITYNYTGAVQTYTVPAGVKAIQIQLFGAGGGGGGSDNPESGGAGARGAGLSGVYGVVPGSVFRVSVGGGGAGSAGIGTACETSGGAGGLGAGGQAGGMGGNRGCTGSSGAGGGGGAASVIATQAGAALLIAGGGGGGQGGAFNRPGRDGLGTYSAGSPSSVGPVTNFSGSLPSDASYCGAENLNCNFPGARQTLEVWYGAQSSWAVAPAYGSAVSCSNSVFGDPIPGTAKQCYVRPYTGSWTPSYMTGGSVGSTDGGGGGGGGGGCAAGAGGAANPDQSSAGPNTTTQASAGSSCSSGALPPDGSGPTVSATGGLGGNGATGYGAPGFNGAPGSVVITYPTLTLAQSLPSPGLKVGANSVYTLTVTNTNTTGVNAYTARVVDQLPSTMTYVSNGGAGWSCSAAANAGGTLVTCDFTGTINANGGTAVLQITAQLTSESNVTNYAAVDPIGGTSPPVPTTCTAAGTPLGCAAPVVSRGPVTISGFAYEDSNHNNTRDAGEIGRSFSTGQEHYVKLTTRTGNVCNFPAIAFATVAPSPSLGNFSFANVPPGDYCLLLQTSSSLATDDRGYPFGYIGTENPTGVIQFTVGGDNLPQNFGLFRGTQVRGVVFADNGAGGGVANNGQRDGAEAGLAGITVILKLAGGAELDRTVSAADGSFTLHQVSQSNAPAVITTVLPSGYTATGGTPGTLFSGAYQRPDVTYLTQSAPRNDTGVSFGMVAPNTLASDGAQTAAPGSVAFYAHTYTAATGGQVTFTLANAASPASPTWSQVLYQDGNCNAALEATDPQVAAPITVAAGQKICLIVKQYVPAGAGLNAQNAITLSAAFSYTNASPALGISTVVATDLTTVSQIGDLKLNKLVSNVTQAIAAATSVSAKPGDILRYDLTAANTGTKPLSTLVVSDVTPAFTNFVSAACPGVLPAGMTGCALTTQPAVAAKGAVQWTFTGSLGPGAQVTVTYSVKLDQ